MGATSDADDVTMSFVVGIAGPVLRISISGELDLASVEMFDCLFDLPTEGIDSVVLDLDALTFCDVTGANALFGLRAFHGYQGRTVHIVNMLPHVGRLMAMAEGPVRALPGGDALD